MIDTARPKILSQADRLQPPPPPVSRVHVTRRDWARTDTLDALTATVRDHGGGSAIAYAWEQQLLRAAAAR